VPPSSSSTAAAAAAMRSTRREDGRENPRHVSAGDLGARRSATSRSRGTNGGVGIVPVSTRRRRRFCDYARIARGIETTSDERGRRR